MDSAHDPRFIRLRLGPDDNSPGSIYVPYQLLSSDSYPFLHETRSLSEDKAKQDLWVAGSNCLEVLGLLVQWLHTGKYSELRGSVRRFHSLGGCQDLKMWPDLEPKETMDWAVKAAMLAWLLGYELELREFRNYAITRLFAALSRKSEQPQLTPDLCKAAWRNTEEPGEIDRALADMVVRNWGDAAVVDQADLSEWVDVIGDEESGFMEKFVGGTLVSLEKRREKVLVAEDYFEPEL